MANSMQMPPYLQLIPGSKSSSPTSQSTSQTTIDPTEAPTVTVDPGQVIRINARFPGQPESVHFSLLPPQSADALYDLGVHQEGSQIHQEGDLFSYIIDTSNMRGGLGWWYFCSKDPDPEKRRAKVGKFIVRDVPVGLYSRGEELLGVASDETKPIKSIWPWALGAGLGGAALGTLLGRALASSPTAAVIEEAVGEVVAAPVLRAANGRFLGAAAAAAEEPVAEVVEEVTESSSFGTGVWIALGVAAASALGYWLWKRHQETKLAAEPKKLIAHVGEEDGFDLLGVD